MILALLAAAATTTAPIDCTKPEGVRTVWGAAIEAFKAGDMPKAKASTDALIAACGEHPFSAFPRSMRAEIAVREGDNDGALAALGNLARPAPPPVGPYSSLIALRALQGKKDATAFGDERARLVEGSARGLSQPGNAFKGRLVESFETNGVKVTAFETDYSDGSFRRHMVFLLTPSEPFGMPGTIMLTTNPMTDMLGGGKKAYFIDEYGCWGHATLDIVEGRKPTYQAMKAKVSARLAGKLNPTSSFEPGGALCAFPGYVSPGYAAEEG